jgi:hypothetical protein
MLKSKEQQVANKMEEYYSKFASTSDENAE